MKSLETISDEITILESERDFGNITPEEEELLSVLNLCYDFLSRTKTAQSIVVPQPEEMKEPGFEDDFTAKYGVGSNALADFAFAIASRTGQVDMRALLGKIMWGHTKREIAAAIGIRSLTISDYMNQKSSIGVDTFEKIVNYTIKHKKR